VCKKYQKASSLFPNLDESVRVEDIANAIYGIDSYLDCRPHCTDRDQMLRLKRRLEKLINRVPSGGINGKS
jgi:hypothetical protein